MSYYGVIDNGRSQQVASLGGWSQLADWYDDVEGEFPEVHHLLEYGWEDDLAALRKQLIELRAEAHDSGIQDILDGLIEFLKDGGHVLVISDGETDEPLRDH